MDKMSEKEIERIDSFADNIDLKKEIDLLHQKYGRENVDDRMGYIVYGLIRGIDVEKYIGPWLTGEDIENIMENEFKKKNIDLEYFEINSEKYPNVFKYNDDFGEIENPITYKLEAIDEGCLEYIIKLERGIELFENSNVNYNYDDFDGYISAIERYNEYEEMGFDKWDMYDIGEYICKNMPRFVEKKAIYHAIEIYNTCQNLGFNDGQTYNIINNGDIKIHKWLDQDFEENFDDKQMAEIRKGISSELDILNIIKYADPKFDWEQMNKIREKLEVEKTTKKKEPKMEI